jgi:hypothetical protein
MSIVDAFRFKTTVNVNAELPELYALNAEFTVFVNSDLLYIYKKILTDVIERTQGLPEKYDSA